ncbi:bifunctional ADP-dependent NAD(P)H-hydrate dehydratase/NAD(P)H-hydrate epimerase [Streptomyces albus]|uniref:bifunctional ADP-dependent NAD(P)H-hydrate dehydratase/NAD(P)H-hydrate epimerase n=1 Tax=Streptomyces sp. NRRL F-5639 TaxID=1463867 RepID=UPI0004C5C3AE|nr:bifunctional ADP-dependent NAD(P)H-hydrate dehydratase/NAD(P)H-hydrate epimerase [Streptomyces sp. NRRL F-5639]
MRTGYGVETVRAAERALMARLPEGALMQRAAAGLAAACTHLLGRTYGTRVVLLVGSGDNGGDALYAGARLARRGAGVTAVLLAPERAHPGGLAALRAAGGRTTTAPGAVVEGAAEPVTGLIARADLVVDGIVGIGGKGGLRPAAVELADAVREAGVPVVAVDLPSGVNADTGEVPGAAVRATATVTFGAYKPGLLIDPARELASAVRLVDIGLGPHLPDRPDVEALQHADVARLLPRPQAESDKYRRGVVGVVAGSARYPGAAVLAVAGALRSGAGAVRYVGPGGDAVIARFPETLVSEGPPGHAGRVQAWAVGPGLGDEPAARRAVAEVLAGDVPVLVDADGLRLMDIDAVRARRAPTLLTPHAGEAAALLGVAREEVEAGRLAAVRELAERTGATVLLKGSTTLVAAPPADSDGAPPVRVNATGTGWLATAGSGDVLTGLAGGLLAAGLSARDAASAAAHVHGLAGRFAADPPTAMDVAAALTAAWQDVMTPDR